jgi:hypothetical protein
MSRAGDIKKLCGSAGGISIGKASSGDLERLLGLLGVAIW